MAGDAPKAALTGRVPIPWPGSADGELLRNRRGPRSSSHGSARGSARPQPSRARFTRSRHPGECSSSSGTAAAATPSPTIPPPSGSTLPSSQPTMGSRLSRRRPGGLLNGSPKLRRSGSSGGLGSGRSPSPRIAPPAQTLGRCGPDTPPRHKRCALKDQKRMVRVPRLELGAFRLGGGCSIHLSYTRTSGSDGGLGCQCNPPDLRRTSAGLAIPSYSVTPQLYRNRTTV